MADWTLTLASPDATIREVIGRIDMAELQIALIVDEEGVLLGVITDGDIRRAILRGVALDERADQIMCTTPTVADRRADRETLLALMQQKGLHQIPIVDERGRVQGLEVIDALVKRAELSCPVVIMAGGLGTRLRPLTEDCPKPLLRVGDKPILETILDNLIAYGFRQFYFSVNYKAAMIMDYFGDGHKWNVRIEYLHENERLGTAGSLSLLPEVPAEEIVVMNGDLLTKLNFSQLIDFHRYHQAVATMCVREYDVQVPYGVVETDEHWIVSIKEKPVKRFFVNAGVYVLDNTTLQFIPRGQYFDMPDLFEVLGKEGHDTAVFPVREYWRDIGRRDDYDKALMEFGQLGT